MASKTKVQATDIRGPSSWFSLAAPKGIKERFTLRVGEIVCSSAEYHSRQKTESVAEQSDSDTDLYLWDASWYEDIRPLTVKHAGVESKCP